MAVGVNLQLACLLSQELCRPVFNRRVGLDDVVVDNTVSVHHFTILVVFSLLCNRLSLWCLITLDNPFDDRVKFSDAIMQVQWDELSHEDLLPDQIDIDHALSRSDRLNLSLPDGSDQEKGVER